MKEVPFGKLWGNRAYKVGFSVSTRCVGIWICVKMGFGLPKLLSDLSDVPLSQPEKGTLKNTHLWREVSLRVRVVHFLLCDLQSVFVSFPTKQGAECSGDAISANPAVGCFAGTKAVE